jgi:hypothetical protein
MNLIGFRVHFGSLGLFIIMDFDIDLNFGI